MFVRFRTECLLEGSGDVLRSTSKEKCCPLSGNATHSNSRFPSLTPVHVALRVTSMVAAGGDANAETRPLARGDGPGFRILGRLFFLGLRYPENPIPLN